MLLDGKISTEHKFLLKDKLENASDEQLQNVPLVPLKNPIIGLILGFFFGSFGIDRFYQGNVALGLTKLGIFIVGIITLFIFVGVVILWILYIYVLVDLFFVYKAIQNDNCKKILNALGC